MGNTIEATESHQGRPARAPFPHSTSPAERFRPGARKTSAGVEYCVWAPVRSSVEVEIQSARGAVERRLALERRSAGWFCGIDPAGEAGALYKFRLDGGDSFPDPASRWQPQGVHGPSCVIDPTRFQWSDAGWRRPPLRDQVIYEFHVGAFTPGGTFRSAIERLEDVRQLGATAIEIMPVADFPGGWNWGYDGVYLYAPSRAYGRPDDFRALVDAAHQLGLTVILDVVYNHFGPDGNYLSQFIGNYLDEDRKSPWGGAIRYDSPEFRPLRQFVVENPRYWMSEFHVDAFRLDATHAILDDSPRHLLEEISDAIHREGGFVIAEDSRNDSRVLVPVASGGLGMDGVWADDFHHVVRVAMTGENESYLSDFAGTAAELVSTLQHGWFYRGQYSRNKKGNRGTECRHLRPEQFVHCISNHDQIGNRARGDRLSDVVSPEAYRAAAALLCLSPYTPLLFMGQEWASSRPFLFFTDHNQELGKLITAGRRDEFKHFKSFSDPRTRDQIPDPQSPRTFEDSKLDWEEPERPGKAGILTLHRACLELRSRHAAFRPAGRSSFQVEESAPGIVALRYKDAAGDWLVLFALAGEGRQTATGICGPGEGGEWRAILSTNESRFGGSDSCPTAFSHGGISFSKPELALFRLSSGPRA